MINKKSIYNLKNSPVESITYNFIQNAISHTQSSYIKEKIGYNYIKKGWIEVEINRPEKGFKSFYKALKIFKNRNNNKGYILSYHGIAYIFNQSRQYHSAITIYFKLLNLLNNKNIDIKFIILKDIAFTYYNWNNYKEALNYYKKAMNLIKNENSIYRKIFLNYEIGRLYIKLMDLSKAQESLFMALTICDANGLDYKISEILTNLGNIFRKKQLFQRSESFHIRALQYAKSKKDFNSHVNTLLNFAILKYFNSEYSKTIELINAAIQEIEYTSAVSKLLPKAYYYLFISFKELGVESESIKFLQKYLNFNNSEFESNLKLQNKLSKIQIKMESPQEFFYLDNTPELSIIEPKELIYSLQSKINTIITYSKLNIYIVNSKNQATSYYINKGGEIVSKKIKVDDSPILDVINNNKEIIFYDRETSSRDISFNKITLPKGMNSFIFIPFKISELLSGVISIEDKNKNKYSHFEQTSLKLLTEYASLSIENSHLKNEMESLNRLLENDTIIVDSDDINRDKPLRDKESNIPYRELFIELFKHIINGTKRNNEKLATFSILLNFKYEISDSKLTEDVVFSEKSITDRLKSFLRAEDILGMERQNNYILVIKYTEISDCQVVAEKIIKILTKPIYTENQRIDPIVNIGISLFPTDDIDPEKLIEKAIISSEKSLKTQSSEYRFYSA